MSSILIIESDQRFIHILQQILARHGFTTTGALDGNNTIEICHENSDLELVIIDFNLKETSANALIGEIFDLKPEIKIIITTEDANDPAILNWLKKTNTYFLKKPYDTKDLLKIIRDMAQFW